MGRVAALLSTDAARAEQPSRVRPVVIAGEGMTRAALRQTTDDERAERGSAVVRVFEVKWRRRTSCTPGYFLARVCGTWPGVAAPFGPPLPGS